MHGLGELQATDSGYFYGSGFEQTKKEFSDFVNKEFLRIHVKNKSEFYGATL